MSARSVDLVCTIDQARQAGHAPSNRTSNLALLFSLLSCFLILAATALSSTRRMYCSSRSAMSHSRGYAGGSQEVHYLFREFRWHKSMGINRCRRQLFWNGTPQTSCSIMTHHTHIGSDRLCEMNAVCASVMPQALRSRCPSSELTAISAAT